MASPNLDQPCTDDKRLEDEEKLPDILDKEDIPVDAEETKDSLPGVLNGNNGYNIATYITLCVSLLFL